MARMPRLVVPGYPHHVTQRGNRRMKTFFTSEDYQYYLALLSEMKADAGVEIWAYCLMPNHVHLVVVPTSEDSLSRLFRRVHREYTRMINFRNNWKGHLWQERYHSFVMDESYLHATVRYVELNPVKAGLTRTPYDWKWSSANAHLQGQDDSVVSVRPMLKRIHDWSEYLSVDKANEDDEMIRKHSSCGRPAGSEQFIGEMERLTRRVLVKGKPGPKGREK